MATSAPKFWSSELSHNLRDNQPRSTMSKTMCFHRNNQLSSHGTKHRPNNQHKQNSSVMWSFQWDNLKGSQSVVDCWRSLAIHRVDCCSSTSTASFEMRKCLFSVKWGVFEFFLLSSCIMQPPIHNKRDDCHIAIGHCREIRINMRVFTRSGAFLFI